MPDSLANRVAVITGASRGLGKAMALALAAEGARIALVARDPEQLNATAAEISASGAEARVFRADVADEQQVATLEREVISAMGGADILINNAGINVRKPLVDFTLEEWNRVMTTNVTGVFLMCRAFIPHMRGHGYGRIINLTSIMSHVSLPGRAVYSASKAALLGMTRALALELAPDGVTVVAISPGPFATEMNTPLMQNPEINQQFISKIPVGRWGNVDEVGKLAAFICSPHAGFITGTDILIDGGWCAQ
jgi:NAD(P)-dependent dehydrogenase (short-subunit alcohol dehydrogenase family)